DGPPDRHQARGSRAAAGDGREPVGEAGGRGSARQGGAAVGERAEGGSAGEEAGQGGGAVGPGGEGGGGGAAHRGCIQADLHVGEAAGGSADGGEHGRSADSGAAA